MQYGIKIFEIHDTNMRTEKPWPWKSPLYIQKGQGIL